MIVFGDAEPEDAWHPDDPPGLQLEQLVRRVELLVRHKLRTGGTDPWARLDAVADLVAVARRRHLTEREQVRADQLDDDVAYLRARL